MHLIIIIAEIILVMLDTEVESITIRKSKTEYNAAISRSISNLPPINASPPKGSCVKLQCKYICFNGSHASIKNDVIAAGNESCDSINELHLLNYEFPLKKLPKKLLGEISDSVYHLFIYSSNVEHIDDGAFESKTLIGVHLEGLKIKTIDKNIFRDMNFKFTAFTLIQTEPEIEYVNDSFLELIKYQIKTLVIQTGLTVVQNLTNSQYLLNSLEDVNLSHNNFEGRLSPQSFSQLSMIEKLNLTHSAITYLPELIFADIVGTLKMLDLSNNRLSVMTDTVFGWRVALAKDLFLHLNGNPWNCTCDLQKQMPTILGSINEKLVCETPKDVFVPSKNLCQGDNSSSKNITSTSFIETVAVSSPSTPTTKVQTTTSQRSNTSLLTTHSPSTGLECHKDNDKKDTANFAIYWPSVQFDIISRKGFEVDILVTTNLSSPYGILWFSKVTMEFYKMEVNHNEYGLGCYGRLNHKTTVRNLHPNMSYTFCLILKDHLMVSPFSCKSTYINGDHDMTQNAWLTTNMKATGISLMVIGIVLFKFLGILLVFLVIKKKPFLLKGSKRIATQKNDASNILVFPEDKTLQKFKIMEEQLAVKKQFMYPIRRPSAISGISLDSIQSYINPENFNVYEIIPAHQNATDVRYAEVPFKRKRSSNDPLPEVPHKTVENSLRF